MKLIMLDRDGVINEDHEGEYVKSPEEWQAIPGSLDAIAKLNQQGYTVVVVTNQSGIARGYYDAAMLEKIHAKMHQELAAVGGKIEKIYYCPHHPDDNCDCRKPRVGMFEQIAKDFSVDFHDCYFVGDKESDVMAARNVGARPALVKGGYGEFTLEKIEYCDDIVIAEDLAELVELI